MKFGAKIILIFIVTVFILVPITSYAGNGQSSFARGNSYVVRNPSYGFVNTSYPYVTDDEGIVFTLSLGLDTSRNQAHIYLVPINSITEYQTDNIMTYYNKILEFDLLKSNVTYGNGIHNIDTSTLELSVGSYKLIAIVGQDIISTADIYEYYFLYEGATLGILGDGAVRTEYTATVREYVNGSLVDTPLSNHQYANFFAYTGTLTPLPDGTVSAQIRLGLNNFNVNSSYNPDYYDCMFKSLTFDLTNDDGYYTADYCSVYLYNHSTKVNTFLGTLNNLSRRNQTSELQPYSISFPARLVSNGDDLTIQLYIYSFQAHSVHIGEQFDYYVTCSDIWISAYSGKILNPNQSVNDLINSGDALSNVSKPDINFDDLDVNDIVGADNIAFATTYFKSIYDYAIIGTMILVVAVFMLLSYLFFGKR